MAMMTLDIHDGFSFMPSKHISPSSYAFFSPLNHPLPQDEIEIITKLRIMTTNPAGSQATASPAPQRPCSAQPLMHD